jgi:hypothetical protein
VLEDIMDITIVKLGLDFVRDEWLPYTEKCANLGIIPMDCGLYIKVKYNL